MSRNGQNDWGVNFSQITFLQQILDTHSNVAVIERHDDIVFEIRRIRQQDLLTIVCVDPYTASLELVMRIVVAFPTVKLTLSLAIFGAAEDTVQRYQPRMPLVVSAAEPQGDSVLKSLDKLGLATRPPPDSRCCANRVEGVADVVGGWRGW